MKSNFEPLKTVKRTVILDTDIGPDCDDVGAIVMLNAFARKYGIKVSAICSCISNPYTCGAIDIINRWCDPDGINAHTRIGITDRKDFMNGPDTMYYNKSLCEKFGTRFAPVGAVKPENAVNIYIDELEKAEDNSVMFITIGMLNNVAELIKRAPELVERKIYAFVTMAGRQIEKQRECNVVCDLDSFRFFSENTERPIYYSPFETGVNVRSGFNEEFKKRADAENNPVFLSYHNYLSAIRPVTTFYNASYDLTAVHFAFEGEGEHYRLSGNGKMLLEYDTGETIFEECGDGKDYCIEAACTDEKLGEFFDAALQNAPDFSKLYVMSDENEIRMKLTECGQEHVLRFYDELNEKEKNILLRQLENIDFETLKSLSVSVKDNADGKNEHKATKGTTENVTKSATENVIEPMPYTDKSKLPESMLEKYRSAGMEIMKRGAFAAVTMAGGQGTRLGHAGPKGTFYVNVPEPKSLFEIQCSRLKARSEECGRTIPWYIMTSEENDPETRHFFEENAYFGYPKEDIIFFRQLMLPMLDENGKLILENKYTIKTGADGHGGIFRAMSKNGIVADMKRRGIEWIFVGGIDNILVRLADPVFTGFLSMEGYLTGGKSIIKRDAYEKAGVFCMKDGKPSVIEYTEIPPELAELKNDRGEFVYGDAHILCNMFNIQIFEKLQGMGLPYHKAHKKTTYIDKKGSIITPEFPNAYKFEAFIFDAFSYCSKMGVLRVNRDSEFAPIKNKTGEDSPETAREMYLKGADIRE